MRKICIDERNRLDNRQIILKDSMSKMNVDQPLINLNYGFCQKILIPQIYNEVIYLNNKIRAISTDEEILKKILSLYYSCLQPLSKTNNNNDVGGVGDSYLDLNGLSILLCDILLLPFNKNEIVSGKSIFCIFNSTEISSYEL